METKQVNEMTKVASPILLCPIVGEQFRPPAKQLLAALPAGAILTLKPEPENPYDAKAIQVWVHPDQAVESLLDLSGTGWEYAELVAEGPIHIGFIADSDGKVGKKALEQGQSCNREVHALVALAAPGVNDVLVAWEAVGERVRCELSTLASGKAAVMVKLEAE